MKKVKISHLFHWLYAILMLLPVFAIGVTCAYAIFNKNAYQSYAGENEGHSKTTFLTNINEMKVDNWYRFDSRNFNLKDTTSPQNDYAHYLFYTETKNIQTNTIYNTSEMLQNKLALYIGSNNVFSIKNQDNAVAYFSGTNYLVFDFYYSSSTLVYNFAYNNVFQVIEYNNNSYVSEVFYYSIDKVQQSSLFSWSFDSFLAEPFEYITDVFSIPHGNIIVFFASYWLAISIIWLCFDLVMYVPNLVHKWLDKGSIS